MNFVAAHILQCYDMRENDEQVRGTFDLRCDRFRDNGYYRTRCVHDFCEHHDREELAVDIHGGFSGLDARN